VKIAMFKLCRLMIALVAIFFALPAAAADRPQCSERGWYKRADSTPQYPVWDFVSPTMAGHTTQALCCHSWTTWGGDGIQYAILDQCHEEQGCTGQQGLYKRPADPVAAAEWDKFYTASDAESRRHTFGYYNASFSIPHGVQSYQLFTLSELPPAFQQSLGGPLANNCSNIPTPLPITRTMTPRPPVGTPTRTKTHAPPTSGGCPGGGVCSTLTPTAALRTATPTNTPVQPTPVPATAVPTRSASATPPYTATATATSRPTITPVPTALPPTGLPPGSGSPTVNTPTKPSCWLCGCTSK